MQAKDTEHRFRTVFNIPVLVSAFRRHSGVKDGLVRAEHRGLLQIADLQVVAINHRPAVGRFMPGKYAEKGGLASSVVGNKPYFVALENAECNIGEKQPVAKRF